MKHPYTKFQKTEIWKVIEKALLDLETNQDLKINAPIEYLVGYLGQQLSKNGFIIQPTDSEEFL